MTEDDPLQTSAPRPVITFAPTNGRRRFGTPRSRSVPEKWSDDRGGDVLGVDLDAPIEFDLDAMRPRTRAECPVGRPCPWVGCRHHLYLDVDPYTGSIKLNRPDLELEQLEATCSLDLADEEHTLEQVGQIMNVTSERIRQIETKAHHKAKAAASMFGVRDAGGFAHATGYSHQEG